MNIQMLFHSTPSTRRKHVAPRWRPTLESMESRLVLSHVAAMPHAPAMVEHMAKHADALTISNFTINSVSLVNNQLQANGIISGTVKHHKFSIPATIPITLTATPPTSGTTASATPAAATPVSILHLTLGPVNLSLLGLNVHLGASCSFTDNTPITASITAIPTGSTFTSNGVTYQGGLLGDVLSGVANLLNGGTGLSGLGSTLSGLESGLQQILNGLLAPATGAIGGTTSGLGMTGVATTAKPAAAGRTSEVLELPLGPINLDLLGALVQTSPICLNITATRGPGNLLGNLLG